jgi:hypothetical protein
MGARCWCRSWLRHCATSRKVEGSIPDGVTEFFNGHNPSGRTMTLGSTQPLMKMSTRNVSWGKDSRCVGLTTLPPSCANCLEIWKPQPPGTLWACPGCCIFILLFVILNYTLTIACYAKIYVTCCATAYVKYCVLCY